MGSLRIRNIKEFDYRGIQINSKNMQTRTYMKSLLLKEFTFKEPLKHVIEGKIEGRIEVSGKRERRCKQLLDDLKEKTG